MLNSDFIIDNFFDIFFAVILLVIITRSLFSTFLKELYSAVTIFIIFMISWHFHESNYYIFNLFFDSAELNKLLSFILIFVLLVIVSTVFSILIFSKERKARFYSILLRILLSGFTSVIWINAILVIVLLHMMNLKAYLENSIGFVYINFSHQVLLSIYNMLAGFI